MRLLFLLTFLLSGPAFCSTECPALENNYSPSTALKDLLANADKAYESCLQGSCEVDQAIHACRDVLKQIVGKGRGYVDYAEFDKGLSIDCYIEREKYHLSRLILKQFNNDKKQASEAYSEILKDLGFKK